MTTLSTFDPVLDTVSLPLRRFTADEYIVMAQSGAFDERHRVELIEGLVVDMSPSGSPHNHFLLLLNEIFSPLSPTYYVAIQGTLEVSQQFVFDPDLMLLRKRSDKYRDALPSPADVQLVIEVAETSLPRDMKVKLPVYAASGIAEYWVIDINREVLIVHRSPEGSYYSDVRELRTGDAIAPLAAPDFSVEVARIFA